LKNCISYHRKPSISNFADISAEICIRTFICRIFLYHGLLARIIHEASTAEADPGLAAALHSFELLDVLSSMSAVLSVARLFALLR